MKTIYQTSLLLLTGLIISTTTFSQTFEQLYDGDSTVDIGSNIFVRPDSTYMAIGTSEKVWFQYLQLMTMTISADGSHKTGVHLFNFGTQNCFVGSPGTAKRLRGGYLAPIEMQSPSHIHPGFVNSFSGLVKYNASGDTVFVKTYNDTNSYFAGAYDCAVMRDRGYLLAAILDSAIDSFGISQGMLIRTDSNGNKLWQKLYRKIPNVPTVINRIDTLNGKILIDAELEYPIQVPDGTLNRNKVWFLVLDSTGNILRDTLLNDYYIHGGGGVTGSVLEFDKSGGYFWTGALNIFGYPRFVAHLDTDFNITWADTLFYSNQFGQRIIYNIRQLHDSSYAIAGAVVVGDPTDNPDDNPQPSGWTAKISKEGILLWQHYHAGDSTGADELADVAERGDGSLVFCGDAWNDSLPVWHIQQDIWLISVDSNGCLQPGCDPDTSINLAVPQLPQQEHSFIIYPNPTIGTFIINTTADGNFILYTMMGQRVGNYKIIAGQTTINLPVKLADGIYMGTFYPGDGTVPKQVRMLLQR